MANFLPIDQTYTKTDHFRDFCEITFETVIIKFLHMKKSAILFTGVLLVLVSFFSQAQINPGFSFYKGKWNASFDGPLGTVKMEIGFEQVGENIVATINDEAGKTLYKVVRSEIKEYKATIIFIGSQGSEVDLVMNKKDDDHTNCSIMGIYSTTAERKK